MVERIFGKHDQDFITEFEKDNEIYAIPNIYAEDWDSRGGDIVGCTVVGELSDVMVYDTNTDVTIH